MALGHHPQKTLDQLIISYFWIALGAFLAALSIRVFLFPNNLIDGGIVGLALIGARLVGDEFLSLFLILFNLPFIYLAYKHIRRTFVIQMAIATGLFAFFLMILENISPFLGDPLEIIVFGGAILGIGVGLMIRNGGSTDGTEVLGIIINRKKGFTVGQVVLVINIFVFSLYGWIFHDWHIALKSMMTYIVAFKMIDLVIVGLDELKSVMIITSKPNELAEVITGEMGLGLT
ncbi:MAG: YitT family protein, partial [Chlamydiae bacterium]|nr:YitT family protein [Chlamydiota bacterium]